LARRHDAIRQNFAHRPTVVSPSTLTGARGSIGGTAEAAKRDCAVSKALAGVEEINLEARLVERAG
jgi:hypothetical protein